MKCKGLIQELNIKVAEKSDPETRAPIQYKDKILPV